MLQLRKGGRRLNRLAEWFLLQRQKKRRQVPAVPHSGLFSGLLQFYSIISGATHVRSWNETESLPDNPMLGFSGVENVPESGTYGVGDSLRYVILPFRVGAQKVFAGFSFEAFIGTSAGDALGWTSWYDAPSWCTGFTVMRYVNDAYSGCRDMNAATMYAGWLDDGSGWSSSAVLPFTFASPPVVAKVLWNIMDSESPPQAMATQAWFGGHAFDIGATGSQLVRFVSEDLRRLPDGTFAFWFSTPGEEGVVAAVRGVVNSSFSIHYAGSGSEIEFGDNGQVITSGHLAGDWYLVAMRKDSGANTLTIDVLRQRDQAHYTATVPIPAYSVPLTGASDYAAEGIGAVLTVGGSWYESATLSGQADRIGIWDRPLTNAEVLELFNGGAGWKPV